MGDCRGLDKGELRLLRAERCMPVRGRTGFGRGAWIALEFRELRWGGLGLMLSGS